MLRNRLAIILIIVLAILIRITAIFILGSPKVWECEEITDNILAGKGFFFVWLEAKHFSHTEPFYSYLSSLVYLLSRHSHLAMVLVQIFISVLLILIVYLIGKTIFNLTAGSISAFIVAIHPGFIYYDVKNLHPLGLGAMFIALSVWLMILFKKNPSLKMASLTGFVSGIGTLARGTVGSF
jgi:4-amino-4-deoxy-L-arabinose transferase-like glycosyltransferase